MSNLSIYIFKESINLTFSLNLYSFKIFFQISFTFTFFLEFDTYYRYTPTFKYNEKLLTFTLAPFTFLRSKREIHGSRVFFRSNIRLVLKSNSKCHSFPLDGSTATPKAPTVSAPRTPVNPLSTTFDFLRGIGRHSIRKLSIVESDRKQRVGTDSKP